MYTQNNNNTIKKKVRHDENQEFEFPVVGRPHLLPLPHLHCIFFHPPLTELMYVTCLASSPLQPYLYSLMLLIPHIASAIERLFLL
jgi:hypothetical protein